MNFTRTVTIELELYQSMEDRLKKMDEELAKYSDTVQENQYLSESIDSINQTCALQAKRIEDLRQDNARLTREVESLQVQHRNDQGLD